MPDQFIMTSSQCTYTPQGKILCNSSQIRKSTSHFKSGGFVLRSFAAVRQNDPSVASPGDRLETENGLPSLLRTGSACRFVAAQRALKLVTPLTGSARQGVELPESTLVRSRQSKREWFSIPYDGLVGRRRRPWYIPVASALLNRSSFDRCWVTYLLVVRRRSNGPGTLLIV
jgi:hypothetical protein